jgi:acyl-CoA synthetase (NDP forming)
MDDLDGAVKLLDHLQTLLPFCNPGSVAIIGASRSTGPGAFSILENLINYGYKGRIYPVNPKAKEILGLECYARAQDLPEVVDLAIVTVPRELLARVIRDGCERGIRNFTLVAQGLAEADAAGAAIQDEFMGIIRAYGARILGPNTLGTVNAFDGFTSSFMPLERPADPLASGVICQTGLFLATDLGLTTGIGLGVDIGNQADIGFTETLRFLGDDPRVRVVCLHMEGLRPGEGRAFLEAARDVVRRKPVLVYKTARSAAGAKTAGSHSGSLAGSHAVYEAALREAGVILLEDVEDMDDSVKAFLYYPPMRGRRVFIVTVSGGGGIMAADACEDYGLELAELTPETMRKLRDLYPSWMEAGNPLDVWPATIGRDYRAIFATCFEAVATDPNVDGIICVGGTFAGSSLAMGGFIALASRQYDKPITWWVHGRRSAPVVAEAETTRRVAAYPSADRAVRALSRLATYYVDVRGEKEKDAPTQLPTGMAADRLRPIAAGGAAPARARALGVEAYDLLSAYGVPAARWRVAGTAAEAVVAAREIGFPVVLKPIGPGVLHKTELSVVHLDLSGEEAVFQAASEVLARLAGEAGEVKLLLQEYLQGGHEIIIGARRDSHFGPIVLAGMGGIFAEVLQDVAIGLAPLTPLQAETLLAKSRGFAVLRGLRGQPASDTKAVVDALVRLSWLVSEHPEIVELDLNPVKVFVAGRGCRVLDARILVG